MSSFIQMFSFDEDDGNEEDVEHEPRRMPPWFGPPEDELGAVVPLGLVAARSESGVVALSHATVYSTGLALDVIAAARGLSESQSNRLFHEQHLFEEGEEPPAGFLRIGLELPDGNRVSNLGGRMGRRRFMKPDEEPDGPVLMEHGGGGGSGGGGRVRLHPAFWLWPQPESGTLRFFCEWPVAEIPLSFVDLDAGELEASAGRAVRLWPSA
jgi:hypothetical protein